jgi:hypothetical protein
MPVRENFEYTFPTNLSLDNPLFSAGAQGHRQHLDINQNSSQEDSEDEEDAQTPVVELKDVRPPDAAAKDVSSAQNVWRPSVVWQEVRSPTAEQEDDKTPVAEPQASFGDTSSAARFSQCAKTAVSGFVVNSGSSDGHTSNGHIRNGHISNGTIGNGHIGNGHIGNGHIGSSDIINGYIGANNFRNGLVGNGHINNGYLGNGQANESPLSNRHISNFAASNGITNPNLYRGIYSKSIPNGGNLSLQLSNSSYYGHPHTNGGPGYSNHHSIYASSSGQQNREKTRNRQNCREARSSNISSGEAKSGLRDEDGHHKRMEVKNCSGIEQAESGRASISGRSSEGAKSGLAIISGEEAKSGRGREEASCGRGREEAISGGHSRSSGRSSAEARSGRSSCSTTDEELTPTADHVGLTASQVKKCHENIPLESV